MFSENTIHNAFVKVYMIEDCIGQRCFKRGHGSKLEYFKNGTKAISEVPHEVNLQRNECNVVKDDDKF